MTLPEALTALVAAGRIRSAWLPGMLTVREHSGDLYRLYSGSWGLLCGQGEPAGYVAGWESIAALLGAKPTDDPATNGCLLALLREAANDPLIYVSVSPGEEPGDPDTWSARQPGRFGSHALGAGPTEHAALSAALIALAESP